MTYVGLDGLRRPAPSRGPPPADLDTEVEGVVERGHGVASGKNPRSPHPRGTIEMQYPIFKELGLDLGPCFPGTLNVSIAPKRYRMTAPSYVFREVAWSDAGPSENFFITPCFVAGADTAVGGFVYQPDPETKTEHYDHPSHLQVIAPYLPLRYGDRVTVSLRSSEVALIG